MGETRTKGWTCTKPQSGKEEPLCLPTTRKQQIPGYGFQTSTSIGLKPMLPPSDYFEVKPLLSGKDKNVKNYKYIRLQYRTTSSAHDGRQYKFDPLDQANRIGGTNCHFMKEFEEHSRKRAVDKMSDPQSQYKVDYNPYKFTEDIRGKTTDISNDLFCKIQGIAKNEQPKVDLISPTLISFLDNYVTTTKSDFTYISPDRRDFYKAPRQTFPVKKEKNVQRIFDEEILRFRFLDRIVPKHVPRVPHSGLGTESIRSLKNPWGESYSKPKPVFDDSIQVRITKGDVMKIPGMYSSEYSHYGSKVSPNEIV